MLTITFPPLKGGRGMFYLRAGAAEYVNNKEQFAQVRYAKVIKKYQSAKKKKGAPPSLGGGSG